MLAVVWAASAQHPRDDTSSIYRKIHTKASQHKVTRWLYESMFEDPDDVEANAPPIVPPKTTVNPYMRYKGKIVRFIQVVALDPFGYSVNDTTGKQPDYLDRVANKYHVTTRRRVIRNTLIIEQGKPLDPLEISESERLLRLSPYVNDARIFVKQVKPRGSDSVDIVVVVHDKWSLTVGADFNIDEPNLKFGEKNVAGLGHQFEEAISWNRTYGYFSTYGRYSVSNIRNSFISSSLFYSTTQGHNQLGAMLDRPFYSPLARWAGGASIVSDYSTFRYRNSETGREATHPLLYQTHDVWAAKSAPVSSKRLASINQRSTNFIVGARYFMVDVYKRPGPEIDPMMSNQDQTMYLGNFGFNRRKYYRDRYLYRFGANEDVPEGFAFEVIGGTLKKEHRSQWYYSGARIASGKHFTGFGYMSAGVGYGTFYDKSFIGSGVLTLDAFYFSDLVMRGQWFFRQFTRFRVVNGLHRLPEEYINLNGNQMYGFAAVGLQNKSKMILNLEFVTYAPYKLLGFRFAPVLLAGFGTLGSNHLELVRGPVYQAYALGLLVRNEYLITSTFEITVGLYPYMPGFSDYSLAVNPFNNYNVRARDYQVSRPDLIGYD